MGRVTTGVYKGVHEDGEPLRNAAMASPVVFKIASKPLAKRGSRYTRSPFPQLGRRATSGWPTLFAAQSPVLRHASRYRQFGEAMTRTHSRISPIRAERDAREIERKV